MKSHAPKTKSTSKRPKEVSREKSQRQLRVAESIKRVLADQLSKGDFVAEFEGEIVTFTHPITITQVRISPDLQQAIVSIMPLGGINKEEAVIFVNKMARILRMLLGKHLHTRFTPSLKFVIDETFDQATRIESLLRQITPPIDA